MFYPEANTFRSLGGKCFIRDLGNGYKEKSFDKQFEIEIEKKLTGLDTQLEEGAQHKVIEEKMEETPSLRRKGMQLIDNLHQKSRYRPLNETANNRRSRKTKFVDQVKGQKT